MRKRFTSLYEGLAKTRRALAEGIRDALSGSASLDEAIDAIEETLLRADVGVETALHLTDVLRARGAERRGRVDAGTVGAILADEVERILGAARNDRPSHEGRPHVIMVIGVNGVGKTTTVGKLARLYTSSGKRVLVAASDTFRAAAGEQLSIWADRGGAELVGGADGGDPAAVAYDALDAAIARSADVLIVDTAGRLHTQKNLVAELEKIGRVLGKRLPGAPHETILVLDAGTGQNAMSQARLFGEALDVTAIALTKLDGTARGGIVVAIARELEMPVSYVGVGEGIEDLEEFAPREFAEALVSRAAGA